MNLESILFRQKVIAAIRQFFVDYNFQEINLPVLQTSIPAEQNIYPFTTKWQYSQDNLFLSTSPESGLKQLISEAGLGNCFTIHHSFRDLEAKGPHHQPEFLMLEWYRLDSDYQQIMRDTDELVVYLVDRLGINQNNRISKLLNAPYQQISFENLFKKYAPKSFLPDNEPDINQIFLNHIEPHLINTDPLFITDYPTHMSPLAKPISGSNFSQRFEFYIGSTEIANGCTENLTPSISVPWKNLPPSAGCGLGIDRLAMILSNSKSIDQLLPLPL